MTEQPDNLERTRLRREPQRGSHDPSLIRDVVHLVPVAEMRHLVRRTDPCARPSSAPTSTALADHERKASRHDLT